MRILSILMAVIVAIILYFAIIDRETARTLLGLTDETSNANRSQPVAEDEADTVPLIKVVAQRSLAQSIESAVILRGQTEAARQVEVRSETSATVVSPPLQSGTFVDSGQLLCELDPGTRGASFAEAKSRLAEAKSRLSEAQSRVPESQARIIEAIARLDEAKVNQNAAVKLSEDGFATDTRVNAANAAVAAAEAGVEAANSGLSAANSGIQSAEAGIESAIAGIAAAKKELARLKITAPFKGLLQAKTAELGSLLQPGSLCATIIQLDPIKLVAFIPETEVNRIEMGSPAAGRLAAGGDKISGVVTFLGHAADPTTRTFRVEIKVPNPELNIRDGQTAEILVGASGTTAHLLPQSALTLNNQGARGLRVIDDEGVVNFQTVQLLRDTVDGVWLTGLPEKLDVIVVGQEYVTAGVKVNPTFRELSK